MKSSMEWGGTAFAQTEWPNICAAIEELETSRQSAMKDLMDRERFITEQMKAKKQELEAND